MKRKFLIAVALILLAQGVILWSAGQPLICECGTVKLWWGEIFSAENSQQLSDWYSFSHIIHGFIFYAILHLVFPKKSVGFRLVLAVFAEAGWEVLENSPLIINRYRETALALGYTGDSIINSLSDTVCAIGGFWAASKWPAKWILWVAIVMELFTLFMVRDNLTLNVINIVHPVEAIQEWQAELADQ